MQWTCKCAPTNDSNAASTTFVDLNIANEGTRELDPTILNLFMHAASQDIKYCPLTCDLQLADDVQCCLFCNAVVSLRIMLDHVAEHIANGGAVADAHHRTQAKPCGFCGGSTGTCETTLKGTKVCTNCPYQYRFKYKKTLEKRRNVPRKCPGPMCPTSPFTLNIKCQLRLVHLGLDPKTFEVSNWIVDKGIARIAPKAKAEKGEKVWRITIHVDKEAEEGTGQATTTGDEGGDKYGTQRPAREADEDWCPERRTFNESHGSNTDNSSTTHSSLGGTSSRQLESSSWSSSSDSSVKVVVATGHQKLYKTTVT